MNFVTEKAQSILSIVLMISAAILLDGLFAQSRIRLDLTSDQRHTLSPVTASLLELANEPIEVHAFLPSQIAAPHHLLVESFRDKIADMKAASHGRMKIKIYDPDDPDLNPDEQKSVIERAKKLGLKPIQLDISEGVRRIRIQVWLGAALLYGDRQVNVPVVLNINDIEYAFASALKKLLDKNDSKAELGFTTGHGEPPIPSSPVGKLMSKIAPIRAIDLQEHIPPQVKSLVILGPRKPINRRGLYVIDQFLMRGGHLILMLDHRIQIPQFPTLLVPMKYGFNRLLNPLGVRIDSKGTVLDRTHHGQAPVTHPTTGAIKAISHPGFVRAAINDQTHPITQKMRSLVVPFASPIYVDGKRPPAVEHTILAKSHPTSVVHPNVRKVAAHAYDKPSDTDPEISGPSITALLIKGVFESTFVGQKKPTSPAQRNPLIQMAPSVERPFIGRSQGESKILLVASGARLLGAERNGLVFLQNAVEFMMSETSLSSLRARKIEPPKLTETSRNTRRFVRWVNVLGPTLLLILIGLGLRLRRRRTA